MIVNQPLQQILDGSVHNWLTKEEVLAVYNQYLADPLVVSIGRPGPAPRITGLFLFEAARYSDEYVWRFVNEVRRRNCRPSALGNDEYPKVNYTLATQVVSPVLRYHRRTHHVTVELQGKMQDKIKRDKHCFADWR